MFFTARRWLALPPLVLAIWDEVLTLIYQPASYWSGDYSTTTEGSVLWGWLLRTHPGAFIAATIVYVLIIVWLILKLPRRLAIILSHTVFLWHLIGATSWMLGEWGNYGYTFMVVLCAACSFFFLPVWRADGE